MAIDALLGVGLGGPRTEGERDPYRVVTGPALPSVAAISVNSASAASRSSTISAPITSGAGRLSLSSKDSSRSQEMSREALSLATRSVYENDLNRSVSVRSSCSLPCSKLRNHRGQSGRAHASLA